MSKSFWANLFAPPRERFSLEELRHLHGVLLRNQVITDGNRDTVVEALRSISELVIWGDQHDASIVEYFLTENLLGHFHQILLQRTNRRGNVAMQVLQTLSILIQNLRTQQTVYYLFSNNHINDIAALQFDFDDDEVLGYYVNLLKTISLRLNEATVQFFFHTDAGPKHGGAAAFPLYTEATKFITHRDAMVRAAVKTLTLNVYTISLPSLRDFLCRPPAARYFDKVAAHAAERCGALDRLLSSWDAAAPAVAAAESLLAEIEDLLSYCNDVLAAGAAPLRSLLLSHLWEQVVGPVLFWPLASDTATTSTSNNAADAGQSAPPKGLVGPLCSLFVFERMLHAVTDPLLVSLLVAALLGGPAEQAAETLAESLVTNETLGPEGGSGASGDSSGMQRGMNRDALLKGLHASPCTLRQRVLSALHGNDAQLAAAAVRVIAAVLSHRSLPEGTLEAVGLLPRRRRKQRELLAELTRDASSALITPPPPLANGVAPSASEKEAEHQEQGEPAPKEEAGQEGPSEPTVEEDVGPAGECDQGAEEGKDHPTGRPVLRRYSPRHETIPGSARGPAAAPTEKGTTHFNEVVEGILAALALELLPPLALGTAGWILHRLLSSSGGAAELEPAWQEQLDAVIAKRRAVVRPQVCGLWGDAVLPLAGMLWSRNRSVVLRTGAGPLHVAAQAWVQGILLQELHWQLGGAREQVTASNATTAAKLVCASVQALVGVLQIKEVLAGDLQEQLPMRPPSPADIAARELREGNVVSLGPSPSRCTVAFSKGGERSVLLSVENMPDMPAPTPKAASDSHTASDTPASTDALPMVAAACPAAALLDPKRPEDATKGTVLSVAPLLGACPELDPSHSNWVHVDIRTQLSTLLGIVTRAPPGLDLAALEKGIVSGHWVVAFASKEAAEVGAEAVQGARMTYAEQLELLLVPLVGRSEDGMGCAAAT